MYQRSAVRHPDAPQDIATSYYLLDDGCYFATDNDDPILHHMYSDPEEDEHHRSRKVADAIFQGRSGQIWISCVFLSYDRAHYTGNYPLLWECMTFLRGNEHACYRQRGSLYNAQALFLRVLKMYLAREQGRLNINNDILREEFNLSFLDSPRWRMAARNRARREKYGRSYFKAS